MRRHYLVWATSSFAAVGVLAVAYAFLSTFSPTAEATANRPYFEVTLSEIAPGTAQIFEWHGKPFYVFHRTDEQIDSILPVRSALRDPDSSQVPMLDRSLDQPGRSVSAKFLVVSVIPNHSKCGVEFRPKSKPVDWATPWYGGFFEPCRGAAYDVAGRVYREGAVEAKNLIVIPHSINRSRLWVYVDAI